MQYQINKAHSRTRNTKPSMADQAGAKDTDINVIVGRFLHTGTVPTSRRPPFSGDFTELPTDLRGFIEGAMRTKDIRRSLPAELRDMPVEEILALTPEQLTSKLTPPAPTPATPKEETK